ncbi:DUF1697 domain-containing protein [Mycobacterium stomatepiae]|nr:DUF1697 domain-containing protein [Mycobacterium stomatepiae]
MLRGINVSGHRKVSMADLVGVCEDLGYRDVRSYAQSGNLVFDAGRVTAPRVAKSLKAAIRDTFNYDDVDALIRTGADLAALVQANPYLADGADPKTLHLTMFSAAPVRPLADDGAWRPDGFTIANLEAYVVCPNGYGRTKLNNSFFENKLGVRATTRNWRTITALAQMTEELR